MSSYKSHGSLQTTSESEFVTNWKVVAAFTALTAFSLCGVAVCLLAMGANDRNEPSTSHPPAVTERSPDRPSHRTTVGIWDAADEINESPLFPWRPLPESSSVVMARTDPGNARPKTEDQTAATLKADSVQVVVEAAPDEQNIFAVYADPYGWDLLSDLKSHSIKLDFEAVKGSTKRVLAASGGEKLRLSMLDNRNDLSGLPFRKLAYCEKGASDAKRMQEVSTSLGRLAANIRSRRNVDQSSGYQQFAADARLTKVLDGTAHWRHPQHVSTLVQMLQVESLSIRSKLVEVLSGIESKEATVALAERAIFDTFREVRESAVQTLKKRPAKDYRNVLLKGLRYPWPGAAVYAAEALVEIDVQEAVPTLVALLDQPDPSDPFRDRKKDKWMKRELVRVNHMRNCVLCHAPSRSRRDLVRGLVPTPGKPIPVAYYQSRHGSFVRADVTYLKQDFSVMHEVADASPWPTRQRFDYFVRQREATAEEIAAGKQARLNDANNKDVTAPSYLQRKAVLMALRHLTGANPGDTTESWKSFLATRDESQ